MPNPLSLFLSRFLLPIILITLLISVPTDLIRAENFPQFYVCIENHTNNSVNYQTEWCTRAGANCSGYSTWTIPPHKKITHYGPQGSGRMDCLIYTGGSYGMAKEYNLYGDTEGCRRSSTYVIRHNNRGYLRLHKK